MNSEFGEVHWQKEDLDSPSLKSGIQTDDGMMKPTSSISVGAWIPGCDDNIIYNPFKLNDKISNGKWSKIADSSRNKTNLKKS